MQFFKQRNKKSRSRGRALKNGENRENNDFSIFGGRRSNDCSVAGYWNMIKKSGDIPPRPKFDEESDGATRFLIGPRIQGRNIRFILRHVLRHLKITFYDVSE